MARRFILVTVAITQMASAWARRRTCEQPPPSRRGLQRPSCALGLPGLLHWTPGADPLNTRRDRLPGTRSLYGAAGGRGAGAGVCRRHDSDHFAVPGDRAFCFFIRAVDGAGGTADSNAITIEINTTNPTATVPVLGQAPGGVVSGTVRVTRTSADADLRRRVPVLRLGAVGACGTGTTPAQRVGYHALPRWPLRRCNVVTDGAGHTTTAALTVTVANAVPLPSGPAPVPVTTPPRISPAARHLPAPVPSAPPTAVRRRAADKIAPAARRSWPSCSHARGTSRH